jgi:hypothetical protein
MADQGFNLRSVRSMRSVRVIAASIQFYGGDQTEPSAA